MREHTPTETTIAELSPEDAVMNGWVEEAGHYVSVSVLLDEAGERSLRRQGRTDVARRDD